MTFRIELLMQFAFKSNLMTAKACCHNMHSKNLHAKEIKNGEKEKFSRNILLIMKILAGLMDQYHNNFALHQLVALGWHAHFKCWPHINP